MKSARGRLPSPATVVAVVALVLALGGSAAAKSWKHIELLAEPYTQVGGPSAPAFGNGGEGDCVWGAPGNGSVGISGLNPPSFYRDPLGRVFLSGVASSTDGPGGDGFCGGDGVGDDIVFVLPPAYRPENVEIIGGAALEALVVPDEGATVGGVSVPPGAVLAVGGVGLTVLDGAGFRAAGPGTAPIETDPAAVPSIAELKHAVR